MPPEPLEACTFGTHLGYLFLMPGTCSITASEVYNVVRTSNMRLCNVTVSNLSFLNRYCFGTNVGQLEINQCIVWWPIGIRAIPH